MKTTKIYLFLFLFITLLSCENETTTSSNIDVSEINTNLLIKEFASAVARSSVEPEFLQLIRSETYKQFDYDYDVLYRFIKNAEIQLIDGSKSSVKQLLFNNYKLDGYNIVDIDDFEMLYKSIPNLNICVPFQFKDWQPNEYIPNVAHFPVDWDDDTHQGLETFDSSGKQGWLQLYEDIINPIITVGLSERVDDDGKVKVTVEGYVIPKEDRNLEADQAYEIASTSLKSTLSNEYPSIIQIMPDDFFSEEIINTPEKEQSICIDLPSYNTTNLKSTTSLAAPEITKIVPSSTVGNSIQLAWTSEACEKYKIWYKRDGDSSWKAKERVWSTEPPMIDIEGLVNENKYTFFVQAYKDSSWSAYSNFASLRAGWRKGYGNERLVSIYMDRTCWNDISWARSKAEFYLKVVKFNHSDGKFEFPNVNLGQKKRSEIEWKKYYFDKDFFIWDMDDYATKYWIYFYEEDGGTPIEISLGVKVTAGQKVTEGGTETSVGTELTGSIKFTVGGKDDNFGFLEINNYSSSEIVTSDPPKGVCKVQITQH